MAEMLVPMRWRGLDTRRDLTRGC
uniref:Uncharacterized protein n=1 Tax=Arundo donax TaxID=35708 RepID=A0A0A8Y8V7_ARUDO